MHTHGSGAPSRREWQDPEAILRSAGVKIGMTVADLGCGPGFFTLPLASMVGDSGRVFAVDSRPAALEALEGVMQPGARTVVKPVQADVSKTGIPSGSVDIAFVSNVLHDIVDRAGFMHEVKRMLKPTGRLVVVDWRRVEMDFGPPLQIRLDEESAKGILEAGGFEVTATLKPGLYHYGFVAVPKGA